MGGTCGINGGNEKHTWTSSEILSEGDHFQDLGADGSTYLLASLLTPWSRALLERLTGSAASQEKT